MVRNERKSGLSRQRIWFIRIFRVCCVVLALVCVYFLALHYWTIKQGNDARDAMQELFEQGAGAESQAEMLRKFEPLLQANPDTVGWLDAGDELRFAVVQRDNEYYMDHNFFGEASIEGTAFMDEACCIYPADQHYIIYGHNMRNGTVFGTLKRFRDRAYLAEHCLITFDTLYQERKYVPFAVFDIDAEPDHPSYMDIQRFTFDKQADFLDFAMDAKNRSEMELPISVEAGDRLLSLITCSYNTGNGRLVVMCRALRSGESEDEIRRAFQ